MTGTADALPGYDTEWLTITDPAVIAVSGTDRHPVVRRSPKPGVSVAGTVLSISASDLAAADLYEVDDYRRHLVDLASGTQAWAYLVG